MDIGPQAEPRKVSASIYGAILLCAAMAACYALVYVQCLSKTDGKFIYGLDDPYIHLAIARNLAEHGVWGVTKYGASSASSSPLWTATLALLIKLGGDSTGWPLALAILSSVATTVLVFCRFVRAGLSQVAAFIGAAAIFAVGPLLSLPFTGMENCLQVFLDVVFGFWLLDTLGRRSEIQDRRQAFAITAAMCLCRYESVFLILIPILFCLYKRDWRIAAALFLGPCFGIGAFALYSRLTGMPPIPNSIVLKGNVPHSDVITYLRTTVYGGFFKLYSATTLWDMCVLAVCAGLALRLKALRDTTGALQVWLWSAVVASVFQADLAKVGQLFRYEAYLCVTLAIGLVLAIREFLRCLEKDEGSTVSLPQWLGVVVFVTASQFGLGLVFWAYRYNAYLAFSAYLFAIIGVVAMVIGQRTRVRLAKVVIGTFLSLALAVIVFDRGQLGYVAAPKAAHDIYLQQYQMSQFLARYYPSGNVAANDIGAVSYFTNIHLLDLAGLGSDPVRRLRMSHDYNTKSLGRVISQFRPDLVIAYPAWFGGKTELPSSLIRVATWTLPETTSAGSERVMFYSPTIDAAELLRRQLIEFEATMPRGEEFSFPMNAKKM